MIEKFGIFLLRKFTINSDFSVGERFSRPEMLIVFSAYILFFVKKNLFS